MLCWAFNANFTNASRRTTQESSFHDMHDMPVESPRKEMNCVTHVYAHCVTHVCAPCREGERAVRHTSAFEMKDPCKVQCPLPLSYVAGRNWRLASHPAV